jgi:hypothetical protein
MPVRCDGKMARPEKAKADSIVPRPMSKPRKPKTWTDTEKRQLAKLAKRGAGVSKISAELGRYARSVKLMAREMGLLLKK